MFNLCEFLKRDKKHLFQKCLPMEKVKVVDFPCFISEKFDGVFCCAIEDNNGNVHICSRTGEEYFSMEHLKPALGKLLVGVDFLIFEAWIANTPQSVISGYCRDTKGQHPELKAMVHTFVYDDWFALTETYSCSIHSYTVQYADNVCLVAHWLITSIDELAKYARAVWDRGGEGLVIHKTHKGNYQWGKRNSSMIKMKQGISVDLEVVGVYEGKGKYAGTLGGLLCRYKDNKEIGVSGMTDEQRKKWWNDPKLIIGQIVQIDAMCESIKGLLREPRFKGIRYDKECADF